VKRNSVLKVVNPVLGLLLISQALTGILHDALPEKVFEVGHVGGGILLLVVAALHVILNWPWVKNNFLRRRSEGSASEA